MNHTYGRSATLWEGRHKGAVVSSEGYLLACMRYIEMNPLRAGMVKSPGEYLSSSYQTNINGCGSGVFTPHSSYMKMGAEAILRAMPTGSYLETHWILQRYMQSVQPYNRTDWHTTGR